MTAIYREILRVIAASIVLMAFNTASYAITATMTSWAGVGEKIGENHYFSEYNDMPYSGLYRDTVIQVKVVVDLPPNKTASIQLKTYGGTSSLAFLADPSWDSEASHWCLAQNFCDDGIALFFAPTSLGYFTDTIIFRALVGYCVNSDTDRAAGCIDRNEDPTEESFYLSVKVTGGPSLVPLPASLPLFSAGLAILGLLGWRRKHRA